MFRALYDWTIRWAGSRHAEKALGGVSFVESSVFPIPADVLFVPMCLARPEQAMRYALIATVTSVLGGILGWAIGLYAFDLIARPILEFYGKYAAFEALKAQTGEGAILLMLVTSGLSHLPPMKVVTILSGVVAFDLKLFILSAIVARGGGSICWPGCCGAMVWRSPDLSNGVCRLLPSGSALHWQGPGSR
ncbi:YqaA family protein [Gemmobacter lanyuensis]